LATLKQVGPPPTAATHIVDVEYLNALLAANLSQAAVTARITSNLSGYATQAWATQQLTGLATPAYLATQAGNYVPLSSIGQPQGPIPLSALGLAPANVVQAASTQTWPSPVYSPPAYQTVAVTTDNPLQLFAMSQSDPGYPYVLECTGIMDTQVPLTDNPFVGAQVLIRQGSTTGPIIAFGYGIGQSYIWGDATLGVQSDVQLGAGTEWAQYYSSTNFGTFATHTAGIASWGTVPSADGNATCRCRCLDPVFGTTTTSYQAVSITLNSGGNFNGVGAIKNDLYARMDDTGTYYVRCSLDLNAATVTYSLGGGTETQIGSSVSMGVVAAGDVYTFYAGTYSTQNLRQFMLYRTRGGTTTLIGTWNDTNNASALGSPYLGWGFGAVTGALTAFFITTQYYPPTVNDVRIVDPANPASGINSSTAVILPAPLAGQSAITGPTTLYVMLQSSNQSGAVDEVTVTPNLPGLAVMPIPWAA
jgi:hypothetical protein